MSKQPPSSPAKGLYGISANEIATLCRVDVATARRWKRGATRPPETSLMFIARDLGCFDEAWRGWTIRSGMVISPEGWTVSRNDALTVPPMHAQIASLRAELAKARELIEELKQAPAQDEQPLPSP